MRSGTYAANSKNVDTNDHSPKVRRPNPPKADFRGMIGIDKRPRLFVREVEYSKISKNFWKQLSAKNLITKARSIVSPYFGARDLSFAYALS